MSIVDPKFGKVVETLRELPVANVAEDVVKSVQSGKVTILTAETGSGKTLLANSMLADASDHQVVVLVPRRFLAINAAETIASIAGHEVGNEVGYGIGRQGDEHAVYSDDTKLIFATYGYAIKSGLIDTAKTIVADEVHEAGVDTSLARALLHRRLQNDPELRVMEMSATVNAEKQAAFWQDIRETATFFAEGKAYPCEVRHTSPEEKDLEKVVPDLIRKEGRKGVAVFRPGVKEVEDCAAKIEEKCKGAGLQNVEVAFIYGDMGMKERDAAVAPPAEGNVKVLVGTNVIESGVNIKWLDTGVSDGKCKVPYFRETGAEALVLEELPQWRIVQQEGRVKRFTDGIFVLVSKVGMEDRPEQASAEIERISLTGLVMRACSYNINPMDLKYDAPVSTEKLLDAKKDLQRLEIINDDWSLTKKGEYVSSLPLGAEAGAMLYSAAPEIQRDVIQMAAIVEMGGLRADFKKPHGLNKNSDALDGLAAYKRLGDNASERDCGRLNVSWKRYNDVKALVQDITDRLKVEPDTQRDATERELVQALLHGSVNRMFEASQPYFDISHNRRGEFKEDECSVVGKNDERFAIGYLREIPTRTGKPLTIVQQITKISKEALCEFAASREGVLTDISITTEDRGRGKLHAKFMGETPITINIPQNPTQGMLDLIQRYREASGDDVQLRHEKPQGVGNTEAEEPGKKQARGKGGK